MQLNNKPTVVSNHQGRSVDFQLDLSNAGHITQILRKQIYSRHDLAVVREYITNAIDEHIKHNVTHPVAITLPSRHNNYMFKVRDFAKGLPAEEVEDLYVKYGASTKRESNTQAGCLGIGCKAAFAYTDTFNITSYHPSGTHKYVATLTNATGQLHHISSESDYGEPTGMLIEVPVPEGKVNEFINVTTEYLDYLDKTLFHAQIDRGNGNETWAIENSDDPELRWKISEDSIFLQSDDTAVYPWYFTEINKMNKNNCVVVMGNVPYPIDASNLSDEHRFLSNPHLVIEAPLGSLSIAANREEIQYDDRSKLTLSQIETSIEQSIQSRIQITIEQAPSWAEAIKAYKASQESINPQYRNSYYASQRLWNEIKNYSWKGTQLSRKLRANKFRYSEHIRKNKYSNAATTPFTWTHDHQGHNYGKINDSIELVKHDGTINRVYLWNPEDMSEHMMKQVVGYNHRTEEDANPDRLITWNIVSPRADCDDPSYDLYNYDELKTQLSFLGDNLREVSDLPKVPRKAQPQQFKTSDGSTIQTTRSQAKYECQITPNKSRQTDRLEPVTIDDDNPLEPSFTHGDKAEEVFLFFPFYKNKLLYPNKDVNVKVNYPFQTEHIGRMGYCPLQEIIKIMNPDAHFNVNYRLYAVPVKRKLPENGIWAHDYITQLFNKYSTTAAYKDRCAWESLESWGHRTTQPHECRRYLEDHCLFHKISNDLFKNTTIPLFKELRKFEETIAQSVHSDCAGTDTLRRLFKDHKNYNNKRELDLRLWRAKYDKLLKMLPLLPSLYKNSYLHKWYQQRGEEKVLDLTWEATQKYVKAPIDMETND